MKEEFKLTEEQTAFTQYAVTNLNTFIIVKALAGTGKTFIIVLIVKPLSETGGSIGFFSFNKSVAIDIGERVGSSAKAVTVNAHSFRALNRTGRKFSINGKNPEKWIWDAMDYIPHVGRMNAREQSEVMADKKVIKDLINFTRLTLTDHTDLKAIEEMAINRGIDLREFADQNILAASQILTAHLKEVSAEGGTIDFNDQLWLAIMLNVKFEQFDHVIVDEGQDTTALAREVYERTVAPGGRLITVGDEKQAIYGFMGADNNSLRLLGEKFNCVEFKLTENFRCAKSVIREAQKLVPEIRYHKNAPEGLVAYCNQNYFIKNVRLGDLVMGRRNAPLVPICIALLKEEKPAYIEGRNIGEEIINIVKNSTKLMERHNIVFEDALTAFAVKEEERMVKRKYKATSIELFGDKVEVIRHYLTKENIDDPELVILKIEDIFKDVREYKNGRMITNPGIVLSSIHKQKGAESERVWIVDINKIRIWKEGMTEDELEQEANLEYVAKTRAKMEMYYIDPMMEEEFVQVNNKPEEETVIEIEAEVIKPKQLALFKK
jgi:DNA helicase II / ATP-dependent DNA helicase PcrA